MNDQTAVVTPWAKGTPLPSCQPSPAMLEFLSKRRSTLVKSLTGPGPSDAETIDMLQLAARVPDHGKLGPWRFIIIKGRARARLGAVLGDAFAAQEPQAEEEHLAFERERFGRAPLVIAVVSRPRHNFKIPVWEQILSAGACCQNLLIAANAMGYAAQWLTEWYAYSPPVLQALGVQPMERIAGFIYIGTAATEPLERARPPFDDLYTTLD